MLVFTKDKLPFFPYNKYANSLFVFIIFTRTKNALNVNSIEHLKSVLVFEYFEYFPIDFTNSNTSININ